MENTKNAGFIPRVPKESWMALGLLWLSFAICANCRDLIVRVSPAVIKEFGMSSTTYGILYGIVTISLGILSPFAANWSDRRGQGWARKKTSLLVVIGYTGMTFICGFPIVGMTAFWIFYIIKYMLGGCGESIEVTQVTEWWPEEARGFAFGIHHTGYPWGTALGAILISWILAISNNNWRLPFLIVPLMAIPIWIVYWRFASKKRFQKYEETCYKLGATPSVTLKAIDETLAISGGEIGREVKEEKKKRSSFRACLKNRNIVIVSICNFIAMASYSGFNFWLTPFLTFVGGYDISKAALFSVVYAITGGLGQIFWGRISDKMGRKKTVLIIFAWLTIAFFLMQYVGKGVMWLVLIQIFFGCCSNAVFPVLYSFASDNSTENNRATVVSLGVLMQGIGGGVASLLIGVIIEIGGGWNSIPGYMIALYLLVGLMAIGFVIILLFANDVNDRNRVRELDIN
ncbi:MFS transporter [Clostridium sp. LBM24168]